MYNGLPVPVMSIVLATSAITIDHYSVASTALVHITMPRKSLKYFTLIVLFLFVTSVHLQNLIRTEIGGNNHLACAYVHCEKAESCVHRRFRCKNPPCPGMLYCAKSRKESQRGPSTCDTVHCSNGFLCMVKVRQCIWDQKCKQQIARCVSQQEYYDGPASCAGFKCLQGHQCILRESLCANPPCKLLRSCSKNRDVHTWFGECRSLGCSSEFDCFLRRPRNTCSNPPCKHTTDCITAAENEMADEHCRGWICPRKHKCVAETVTSCESNNCNVNRTCIAIPQNNSSFARRSLSNEDINVQSPEDNVKQFQDWLESIRDILTPSAYADWVEGILASTSRSEEFRKWLRASQTHDSRKVDKHDSIRAKLKFPGRVRTEKEGAQDVAGNQYSIYDTLDEPTQDDLNKISEEINSLLREWNLTNLKDKSFINENIFLPVHNNSETDTLYHRKKEKEISSPDNEDATMEVVDTQISSPNADTRGNVHKQIVLTSQNEEIPTAQVNDFSLSVLGTLRDLSVGNYELPSLWTGFDQDFDKETSGKADTTIRINEISKTETYSGTERYRNNVSADFLEMLVKSLPHFSFEDVQGNFDENLFDRNHPNNANKNYSSSAVPYFGEDRFTSKNLEEVADQSSFYGGARINFTYNSEPRIDDIARSNRPDQSRGDNTGISSIQIMNENNDAADLDRFFEMHEDALLPYIQTLIEAMDLANDSSNELKRNTDVENLEKESRTREPSYENKGLQSFYNLPSYGSSDHDHVDVKNRNNKT
ncbi:uncharacterized protein LOC117218408 isoform X1 [Megalopta genalis]|uniref:uncharacterized protein LOC117218408 isoform X1 n=1 Tax=Megalopta genalis TaxID=115081 RepID=UPI003FD05745